MVSSLMMTLHPAHLYELLVFQMLQVTRHRFTRGADLFAELQMSGRG